MKNILFFIVAISLSTVCAAELKLEKLLKDDWVEVRSKNFIVITDTKEKKAKLLVKDLEHFRYFITQTLGNQITNTKPLKIIAISSRKNFKSLDLPEFWAGVFLGGFDGDIAIANISNYSSSEKNKNWGNQVLMHEYVHFASRSLANSTFFPKWYEEGVAEYLASFRQEDNGKYVAIGNMDVIGKRLYSLLKPSRSGFESVDVEDLMKTTSIKMGWRRGESGKEKRKDEKAADKFYARAMLTYHYLKSSRELSNQLLNYLREINNGKSIDEAFKSSFKTSYAEMDAAIKDYVSNKVSYVRFDAEKAGIKFPEVSASTTTLSTAQAYEELISAILRFGTYSPAERDAALQLANDYAPNSPRVKFSKILYLSKPNQFSLNISDNEFKKLNKKTKKSLARYKRTLQPLSAQEADQQLAELLKTASNPSDIIAQRAQTLLGYTMRQLKVGHPDAKKNFAALRTLARSALKKDRDNAKAYYVLGSATSQGEEIRENFLEEGAMALETAKILYGLSTTKHNLWHEIELNILLGNSPKVLQLSRQYTTYNDHSWIKNGYGRFFIEAQETRAKPFSSIALSETGLIKYDDGSQYSGEIKDLLPHGKGTLTTEFGSQMSGTWKNGFLEGNGTLNTSNGYQYSGNFIEGQASGTGSIVSPKDNYITHSKGQFLMGMEHGEHRFYRKDGRIFEGPMWLGDYHGKITISKDSEPLHSFTAFRGAIRTQVNENLVFAGKISKSYQPKGWGSCYDTLNDKVWSCRFELGALVDNNITVEGVTIERSTN